MTAIEIPAARIALVSRLLVAGLLVVSLTLVWKSPLSFIAFAGLGATLIGAGILIFLWTVIVRSLSTHPGG